MPTTVFFHLSGRSHYFCLFLSRFRCAYHFHRDEVTLTFTHKESYLSVCFSSHSTYSILFLLSREPCSFTYQKSSLVVFAPYSLVYWSLFLINSLSPFFCVLQVCLCVPQSLLPPPAASIETWLLRLYLE